MGTSTHLIDFSRLQKSTSLLKYGRNFSQTTACRPQSIKLFQSQDNLTDENYKIDKKIAKRINNLSKFMNNRYLLVDFAKKFSDNLMQINRKELFPVLQQDKILRKLFYNKAVNLLPPLAPVLQKNSSYNLNKPQNRQFTTTTGKIFTSQSRNKTSKNSEVLSPSSKNEVRLPNLSNDTSDSVILNVTVNIPFSDIQSAKKSKQLRDSKKSGFIPKLKSTEINNSTTKNSHISHSTSESFSDYKKLDTPSANESFSDYKKLDAPSANESFSDSKKLNPPSANESFSDNKKIDVPTTNEAFSDYKKINETSTDIDEVSPIYKKLDEPSANESIPDSKKLNEDTTNKAFSDYKKLDQQPITEIPQDYKKLDEHSIKTRKYDPFEKRHQLTHLATKIKRQKNFEEITIPTKRVSKNSKLNDRLEKCIARIQHEKVKNLKNHVKNMASSISNEFFVDKKEIKSIVKTNYELYRPNNLSQIKDNVSKFGLKIMERKKEHPIKKETNQNNVDRLIAYFGEKEKVMAPGNKDWTSTVNFEKPLSVARSQEKIENLYYKETENKDVKFKKSEENFEKTLPVARLQEKREDRYYKETENNDLKFKISDKNFEKPLSVPPLQEKTENKGIELKIDKNTESTGDLPTTTKECLIKTVTEIEKRSKNAEKILNTLVKNQCIIKNKVITEYQNEKDYEDKTERNKFLDWRNQCSFINEPDDEISCSLKELKRPSTNRIINKDRMIGFVKNRLSKMPKKENKTIIEEKMQEETQHQVTFSKAMQPPTEKKLDAPLTPIKTKTEKLSNIKDLNQIQNFNDLSKQLKNENEQSKSSDQNQTFSLPEKLSRTKIDTSNKDEVSKGIQQPILNNDQLGNTHLQNKEIKKENREEDKEGGVYQKLKHFSIKKEQPKKEAKQEITETNGKKSEVKVKSETEPEKKKETKQRSLYYTAGGKPKNTSKINLLNSKQNWQQNLKYHSNEKSVNDSQSQALLYTPQKNELSPHANREELLALKTAEFCKILLELVKLFSISAMKDMERQKISKKIEKQEKKA